MDYELSHRLPAKSGAYSLEEILQHSSPLMLDMYHESHRMALALQALQKAVEQAVHDPEKQQQLLPGHHESAHAVMDRESMALELSYDLTKERQKIIKGMPSPRLDGLKKAANDPLRMARKHVVDVMRDLYEPILFERYDDEARADDAADVVTVMMLMADNAVNHKSKGQEPAR